MRSDDSLWKSIKSALRANRLLHYHCMLSAKELELFLRSSCFVHKLFFDELSIQKEEMIEIQNLFDKILHHIPKEKQYAAQKVFDTHYFILKNYS